MQDHTDTIAYAIDFGTSNSLISSILNNGQHHLVDIDPENLDAKILRSIFFISDTLEWSYGVNAINQYTEQVGQGRLIRSIKKYLPDESFEGTMVGRKKMSLVDIISRFLRHLRTTADLATGKEITSVVMGRPAVFSLSSERDKLAENRLREACVQAGFKNIEFCAEPIAAGLSLRADKDQSGKLVAICDFGGGTSDFTVLKFDEGDRYEVLGLGGLSLAGDSYDGVIMKNSISPMLGADISYRIPSGSNTLSLPKHIINKLCSAPDINFIGQTEAFELLQAIGNWSLDPLKKKQLEDLIYIIEERLGFKLFESIERTKITLSKEADAEFRFQHYDLLLAGQIATKEFEAYSHDITLKILGSFDETLKAANVTASEIDTVFCTGGTAHLPALRKGLTERFNASQIKRSHEFHSVIHGLSERAFDIFGS